MIMKINKIAGVISLVLVVGVGGYLIGVQKANLSVGTTQTTPTTVSNKKSLTNTSKFNSSPSPTQEIKKDELSDWKIYEDINNKFSFKYPPDLSPKIYDDKSVVIEKWGPTQKEDTEFYDGLSISFTIYPLEGKTFAETVMSNRQGSEEVSGEKISEPTKIITSGFEGLTYEVMGHHYFFYPIGDSNYLFVTNMTNDPTNAGFTEIAEQILSTFVIYK